MGAVCLVLLSVLSCDKASENGKDEVPALEARIVEVDSPRMKIYFPPTEGRRCPLAIVCPGGGYSSIPGADGYEGAFYKDLFNEAGYALVVLYYSLPYVEVVFANRSASTNDNVHPNSTGMAYMAGQIWNAFSTLPTKD